MKTTISFFFVVLSIAAVLGIYSFTLISFTTNPEQTILGSWNEKEWVYEKVYTIDDKKQIDSMGINEIKHLTGNYIQVHVAEQWQFMDGQKLRLFKDGNTEEVDWRIKGRGNILEIVYNNQSIERYNITKLNADILELSFDSDIQVKGLTKLVFEKI